MEFRLSKNTKMFKRSVREYCEKKCGAASRRCTKRKTASPMILLKAGEIGVFGCTVPEKYGGCAMPGEETSMP